MRLALVAAAWWQRTRRMLLGFALGYNAIALSIAWAGLMKPWLAAVLMPTSSLVVLLIAAFRVRGLERELAPVSDSQRNFAPVLTPSPEPKSP